ncbi:MAG: transposase, partial [Chloroflexi bacterium]|nr:transposase [Chloroflexota bacterium]
TDPLVVDPPRSTQMGGVEDFRTMLNYFSNVPLETQLRKEVEELLVLSEQADHGQLPPDLNVATEITFRQERLANLAEAKQVMEARAAERDKTEQAEYEAKQRERDEKAKESGKKPCGREPTPPTPGPRDSDHAKRDFTDPESRIMKNSDDAGFDQHYNAQVAVDQGSLLIVAHTLSNHPNDQAEAIPTLEAIPPVVGKPSAGALDAGYFNPITLAWMHDHHIDPFIATGREARHHNWKAYFAQQPAPPPYDASLRVKMAYRLQTDIGRAIYRLRKCTVEPVIGVIKAVLGFRQFSLRGIGAAAGEWALVCIAFNFKRLHTLLAN